MAVRYILELCLHLVDQLMEGLQVLRAHSENLQAREMGVNASTIVKHLVCLCTTTRCCGCQYQNFSGDAWTWCVLTLNGISIADRFVFPWLGIKEDEKPGQVVDDLLSVLRVSTQYCTLIFLLIVI